MQVLQKIFKFRTCSLDIDEDDPRWRWFRPCLLALDRPVHRAVQLPHLREEYRNDIRRLQTFLEGKKQSLLAELRRGDGGGGRRRCASRRPPGCATKSTCSRRSTSAASWRRTCSRRSSPSIRRRAWPGCRRCCDLASAAADDRGRRHRPHRRHRDRGQRGAVHRRAALQAGLQAAARSAASQGVDDVASIHEAVRGVSTGCAESESRARHPPDRRRQGATRTPPSPPWRAWRWRPPRR